jgi:hypothetical protein
MGTLRHDGIGAPQAGQWLGGVTTDIPRGHR